jgi:hypothetical protein
MRRRNHRPHRVLRALTVAASMLIAGCTAQISGTPEPLPSNSSGGAPIATGTAPRSSAPGGGTTATAAPPSPSPTSAETGAGGGDVADLVPTKDSLAGVSRGLPTDPVDATDALVAKVFGTDPAVAAAAAGEILRRAGLPLVSAAGTVVALPDGPVIVNQPIYVEELPDLADAVRSGMEYTPDQVAAMLQATGVTTSPLTAKEVVGTLAQWGKQPGDPTASVVAGTAARALADWRHELLIPDNVPDQAELQALSDHPDSLTGQQLSHLLAPGRITGLDPLQAILLLAHATSQVETSVTVSSTPQPTTGTSSPSTSASPAGEHLRRPGSAVTAPNALCQFLNYPAQPGGNLSHTLGIFTFQQAVSEAVKEKFGKETADKLGNVVNAYSAATDAVTTVLMLTGATITIKTDKPQGTHFRHEQLDISRDATFTAVAAFSSPLSQKYLGCYAFAGVTIPKNGPLAGFRVHWTQWSGIQVLKAERGWADAFLHGQLTDAAGKATVMMYPRTEKNPPQIGPQPKDQQVPVHTLWAHVVASLSQDGQLVQLTDLLGVVPDGPTPQAIGMEALTVANRFLQQVGLPHATMKFPVQYHGSDPFVINGDGTLWIPFVGKIGLTAQLYSCAGPGGPWKGTVGFTAKSAEALKWLAGVTGVSASGDGSDTVPVTFSIDPKSGSGQSVTVSAKDQFGLVIHLDTDALATVANPTDQRQEYDRLENQAVVGDGSWTFGGQDLRQLAGLLGNALSSGVTFHVVGVVRDSRCTAASVWDDPFDTLY